MRALALLALVCACATAEPRKATGEYPVHASNALFDIGVEYTVHSYAGNGGDSDGQMYLARDILVFEIALFPKQPFQLSEGVFELTGNKARTPLSQVTPEFVATMVRQPDWSVRPHLEAGAGIGDIGITSGGDQRVERFPGDPRATSRLPKPPAVPDERPRKPPADPGQIAIDASLHAGTVQHPAAGNIYFHYTGNPARIKSLTLHVSLGPEPLEIKVR